MGSAERQRHIRRRRRTDNRRGRLSPLPFGTVTRAHLTLITLGPEDGIYGLKVEMINFPIYNIPFPVCLWSFLWYSPNIIRRGIRRPNSFTLTQFWCVYKTNKGQGANDLFCMSPPTYKTTSCFSHLRVLHVYFLGFMKTFFVAPVKAQWHRNRKSTGRLVDDRAENGGQGQKQQQRSSRFECHAIPSEAPPT